MRVVHFGVVVKFFFDRRPVLQALGDGMIGIGELNFDRLLRAMAGGQQPQVPRPRVGAIAKAVHRAVQVNRRDLFMDRQDPSGDGDVFVAGRAFIVNDHIVTASPSRFVVKRQRRIGASIAGPVHVNLDIRAGLDAIGDRFGLAFVVMATTTGDQERFDRLAGQRDTWGK